MRPILIRVESFGAIHNRCDWLFGPQCRARTMGDLEERSLRRRTLRPYWRGLWLGVIAFERAHGLIERIALHRLFPRPADQRDDFVVRQPHRRGRAGFVI